jgi:hypothetical protein
MNPHMVVTECALDYSGPSDHICVGSLFYTYLILIFYYKYSERRHTLFVIGMVLIANLYMVITALALFYLGQTFLFESAAGMAYSLLITVFFLNIDKNIHKYCEKLCFDIFSSRRQKFLLLFRCAGALVATVIYYRISFSQYVLRPEWMKSQCLQEKLFLYRIGIDYSYFDLAVMFMLVGATFGCAFATTNIDCYLFQDTSIQKRLLRTAIGVTVAISIYRVSDYIPADNYVTNYFFRKSVPNFLAAYFVYGLFPYL